MQCSDRYTGIGDGTTYQSTRLEVTAWQIVHQARRRRILQDAWLARYC
jgi:hypothetical protein